MAKRRRQFRVWKDASSTVVVKEDLTPLLIHAGRVLPKESRRAMRHIGFILQTELKARLSKVEPKSEVTAQFIIENAKAAFAGGSRRRANRKTGGRLRQAIGYQDSPSGTFVGWLSKSAAERGATFQAGQTFAVTKKMSTMFRAAAGARKSNDFQKRILLALSKKSQISQPARPVVDPIANAYTGLIGKIFVARLQRNIGITGDAEYAVAVSTILSGRPVGLAAALGDKTSAGKRKTA